MKLSDELRLRGFVNQTTIKDMAQLDKHRFVFYLGVDPSAPSMTIGNLAVIMMVRHFLAHGHEGILLVGGATGLIGDPDGKKEERELKPLKEIEANKRTIVGQYERLLAGQSFAVVDNYDWFKDIGYLDFLRDVGKHVPMRQMLGRDFVQTRLSEEGAGISYAEFSYVLIQAYDFLHLHRQRGVDLQICGSDQWGNSIAGVDLVRRLSGGEVHVWSAPLVINKSTGVKFGKSEDGAVWLDESLTSVFSFYQFWLNVDDASVEDYLKIYTLLTIDEIDRLMTDFNRDKAARLAQKTLAYEVTRIVHGEKKADDVRRASDVLFGEGDFLELSGDEISLLKQELPAAIAVDDVPAVLVGTGLAKSKTEARNFISAGAVVVNGQKLTDETTQPFRAGDNLLRRGKNSFAIVTKN